MFINFSAIEIAIPIMIVTKVSLILNILIEIIKISPQKLESMSHVIAHVKL